MAMEFLTRFTYFNRDLTMSLETMVIFPSSFPISNLLREKRIVTYPCVHLRHSTSKELTHLIHTNTPLNKLPNY